MNARGGTGKRSLAQIDRWYAKYYEAWCGEAWKDAPTFALSRRAFYLLAEQVERIKSALDDPFAPGSGEIIANVGDVTDQEYFEKIEGEEVYPVNLDLFGKAIAWGMAGEDPTVLERLRALAK